MKDKIELSDSFEVLLCYLFGKQNFHHDAGTKTIGEWRKRIDRVIKSISLSIQNTLEIVDNEHKNHLIKICDNIREKISNASDINDLNQETIVGLFNLIFYTLGDRPDHWDLNKVNKGDHWRLNTHRQVMYYQNNERKVRIIIDNAPSIDSYNDQLYNKLILMKKLHQEFGGNHTKFIEWYKENYQELYNKTI